MASTLKINTLTGVSTAGSIAVTGEGNSTTTNLQQGLCKVWALYRQSDNALFDDFNISSTDDDATGQVGFNFTNNMAGRTYSTQKLCQVSDAGGFNGTDNSSIETTQVTLQCRDHSGSDADSNPMSMTVHGDLA
jgi:hypothetical protein